MECLWLIVGLAAVVLLIGIIGLAVIISLIGIFNKLSQLNRRTKIIMGNQSEFDEKINRANAALENIATAIAAEAQQIREHISANPGTDTSALEGVVARLEQVGTSVSTIFEPDTTGDGEGNGDGDGEGEGDGDGESDAETSE